MAATTMDHPEIQQPKWQEPLEMQRVASPERGYHLQDAQSSQRNVERSPRRFDREAMLAEKPRPIWDGPKSDIQDSNDEQLASQGRYDASKGKSGGGIRERVYGAEGGYGERVNASLFSPTISSSSSYNPMENDENSVLLRDYRRKSEGTRRLGYHDDRSERSLDDPQPFRGRELRGYRNDESMMMMPAQQQQRYMRDAPPDPNNRRIRGFNRSASDDFESRRMDPQYPSSRSTSWEKYPIRSTSPYMPIEAGEAEVDYNTGRYHDRGLTPYWASQGHRHEFEQPGCREPQEWDSGRYLSSDYARRLPEQATAKI